MVLSQNLVHLLFINFPLLLKTTTSRTVELSLTFLSTARHTALRCGLNTEIPALTVNRLCGSGFQVGKY